MVVKTEQSSEVKNLFETVEVDRYDLSNIISILAHGLSPSVSFRQSKEKMTEEALAYSLQCISSAIQFIDELIPAETQEDNARKEWVRDIILAHKTRLKESRDGD